MNFRVILILFLVLFFRFSSLGKVFYSEPYTIKWLQLSIKEKVGLLNTLTSESFENQQQCNAWIDSKLGDVLNTKSFFQNPDAYYQLNRGFMLKMNLRPLRVLTDFIYKTAQLREATKLQKYDAEITKGLVFQFEGATDSSWNCLKRAERMVQEDRSMSFESTYYQLESILFSKRAEHFRAIVSAKEALKLVNPADLKQIAILKSNLAESYLKLEDYDEAMKYASASMKAWEESGVDYTVTKEILAVLKMNIGELEESLALHTSVFRAVESQKDSIGMARSLLNCSNVLRRLHRLEESEQLIRRSIAICDAIHLEYGIYLNHINLAELYIEKKHYKESESLLLGVIPFLNRHQLSNEILEVNRLLSSVYHEMGKDAKALLFFQKYTTLKDSLVSFKPKLMLAEYETSIAKMDSERVLKEAEFQIRESKFRLQNSVLIGVILFLVSTTVFLEVRKKLKLKLKSIISEQKTLKDAIELKNRELTSLTLKLASYESFKVGITGKLEEIVEDSSQNYRLQSQRAINDLKNVVRSIKQSKHKLAWPDFEKRFLEVHSSFYELLLERSPDLTPSELRICSLLKLNLTTKEIADITNRSIGTIDNTRARIRKKLMIREEVSLTSYIISL